MKSIKYLCIAALICSGGLSAHAADRSAFDTNHCTPTGNLRGNAQSGKNIHIEKCAECHGYDGKAEGIPLHMDKPPHDQTDADYMGKLDDQLLYLAICSGGEAIGKSLVMPGWGDMLSDQDIRDLIAWIRTFSGT